MAIAVAFAGLADGRSALAATATSTNWSGYYVTTSSPNVFSEVSGSFVIPTLHPPSSGDSYASFWVGLDGATGPSDPTVEQCGVAAEVTSSDQTVYEAWYEFAPLAQVNVSLAVHPGDTIDATVTYEGSEGGGNFGYNFDLVDITTGNSFNQTEDTSSNDQRSSAEWIAEAPTIGGSTSTLANFGNITFSNDLAALNGGSNQSLASLGGETSVEMFQNNKLTALPTAVASNGETFTDNYVTSPDNLVWNNSGGMSPDDGKTWDEDTSYNWNNGASTTVYTDGANVTFNDSNNGHYAVALNTVVLPASVTVNNSDGNYSITGTYGSIGGTGALTKSGTGTLTLSTLNSYSGGTFVNAGVLVIAPSSQTSTTLSGLPNGPLTITGAAKVQLQDNVTLGSQSSNPPTTAPASNVNITSLSIASTATLDIGNNHIIINYGGGADPIATIETLIKEGFDSGTWNGDGITSTDAHNNSASYGIGYADAADPGNPAGLSSGTIEVIYTLLGDANLDGKVNGADFTIMAANFNEGGKTWDQGDFNYDGSVNGADFTLLAQNFNQSASQSAVAADDLAALNSFAQSNGINLAPVPEPASSAILALTAFGILRRRRKSPTIFSGGAQHRGFNSPTAR